jgi:hypothetical protein
MSNTFSSEFQSFRGFDLNSFFISHGNVQNWYIQLTQSVTLTAGYIYDIWLLADADKEKVIAIDFQETGLAWRVYWQQPGAFHASWDGTKDAGIVVCSGVYLFRLTVLRQGRHFVFTFRRAVMR